jgi:hypothetical protein
VTQELQEVRSEPLLLLRVVEEHRQSNVLSTITDHGADARIRQHRLAENVAASPGEPGFLCLC